MTAKLGLRLGPLPKTETVKLTFACSVELKINLERYAELHSKVHGVAVDVTTLIPHMLDSFITRDRAFKKSISKDGLQRSSCRVFGIDIES